MPTIDLSILNQRQTPAFYADVFANRPAAGYVGRIFVSTDTFAFYRDNGTGWDLIGGPGTGTITGSGASGQIALWDGASTITGDTGLTYDGTDNSLTASKFIVTGGTSSQFLKADGSVDSNSYVPYTGATASLDMGANNLLGQNFFVRGDNSTSGGFLGFRQFSGSSSGTNGYTSISALTQNSLYFQFSQTNGTNKTFELSTSLLGTTVRQYQFPDADGTFALTSNLTAYVPYTGATANVNLGAFDLTADLITGATGSFTSSGGSNTFGITHSSGSGIALNISKDGNGEGLFITKGSGSGNAATINGGLVRIENNSGDAQLQIVSSSAPSVRIDNAATGATKRAGLGISTATNNFIQGSADRDFCIFNSSTTASPILFGIYDAGLTNTQEAARISPARNFLIGTTTDAGQKLQVRGNALIDGNVLSLTGTGLTEFKINNGTTEWEMYMPSGSTDLRLYRGTDKVTFTSGGNVYIGATSFTSPSGADTILGVYGGQDCSLILQDNVQQWEVYVNDDFFINRGSTNVLQLNRTTGAATFASVVRINSANALNLYNAANNDYSSIVNTGSSGTANILFAGSTGNMTLSNAGNLLIGTTTDNGNKLQINNGSLYLQGVNANSKFIVYNDYSSSAVGVQLFNNSGVSVIDLNGNAGNINIGGIISTGAPSGGTAGNWKLGTATSGAAVQGGTVRIEINGVAYDLLTT